MRGLFVGRFQPFHLGHFYALKWILNRVDEVIIGIGSAQESYTIRNPFTLGERIEMIWRVIKFEKLYSKCLIVGLPDTYNIHTTWTSLVKTFSPNFDIAFTNDPLSIILLKRDDIKVSNIPFFNRKVFSATNIRKKMIEGKEWRKYVHPEVAKYLDEINASQRLKILTK